MNDYRLLTLDFTEKTTYFHTADFSIIMKLSPFSYFTPRLTPLSLPVVTTTFQIEKITESSYLSLCNKELVNLPVGNQYE